MKTRGFTLVELLVTLAVGAILLMIAIPGYAYLVKTNKLAAVTNTLVTSIQLARSEAIKRGVRVTVCKSNSALMAVPSCNPSAEWHHGWLVFVDEGTRGVVDLSDTLLWAQDSAPDATNIISNNFDRYISYLPSGASQGSNGLSNGTIRVCVSGVQRKIIINTAGRPRLSSGYC
ncbi:MAG TPA: GspH/FimT family pseudopilin [Thiobacillus sp.]